MARLTPEGLRAAAREAIFSAGGRGFVRFGPPGGCLLVSDAGRRAETTEPMEAALRAAGFVCEAKAGMLLIDPADELLSGIRAETGNAPTDWEGGLYPAHALADRWLRQEKRGLTPEGRQMILETLRLLWQPEENVISGLAALRIRAAVMMRTHDTSGLYESGALLSGRCRELSKEEMI